MMRDDLTISVSVSGFHFHCFQLPKTLKPQDDLLIATCIAFILIERSKVATRKREHDG